LRAEHSYRLHPAKNKGRRNLGAKNSVLRPLGDCAAGQHQAAYSSFASFKPNLHEIEIESQAQLR
jgi:hypothetical protein